VKITYAKETKLVSNSNFFAFCYYFREKKTPSRKRGPTRITPCHTNLWLLSEYIKAVKSVVSYSRHVRWP